MTDLEKRYQDAIRKCGGAAGLLALPDGVKAVLKAVTDLEIKTALLEMIATTKVIDTERRTV